MVLIYTDGSALNNKKDAPAGWACLFVLSDGKTILRSGGQKSTNNAAEIQAISYALWYSVNKLELKSEEITIKSDSEYAIGVISGTKNAKANLKAISVCQKLLHQLEENDCNVSFEHVFAHTGGTDEDSKYNDIVDKEARRQATIMSKELSGGTDSGIRKTVYVSKSIPKYMWFSDKLSSEYDVIEFDKQSLEQHAENISAGRHSCICLCHIDDYGYIIENYMFKKIQLIVNDKRKYTEIIDYPLLEFTKSDKTEKYMKYGTPASRCYCCSAPDETIAYEWFYNCLYSVTNFNYLDPIPNLLLEYTMNNWFPKKELMILDVALGYLARKYKTIVKSTDLHALGYGMVNIVIDVSKVVPNSIMRLRLDQLNDFDSNTLTILMNNKDNGFVPITELNDRLKFTISPICKPVNEKDRDRNKCKNMFEKIRVLLKNTADICFTDYHWDNIMELNGEYVVVDIDFNAVDVEKALQKNKPLPISEFIDKKMHIGWRSLKSSISVLNHFNIPVNNKSVSFYALECFELADYTNSFVFTDRVMKDLEKRLRNDLDLDEIDPTVCTAFISKSVPKYNWFVNRYAADNYPVRIIDMNDMDKFIEQITKANYNAISVVHIDEFLKLKEATRRHKCLIISHFGYKYDFHIWEPVLEVGRGESEKYLKFGSFAQNCYCCRCSDESEAYEWFYNNTNMHELVNWKNINDIYQPVMSQHLDIYDNSLFNVRQALGKWGNKHKITLRSNEITPLGNGVFNCVYDISKYQSDSVIRIHTNMEMDFDGHAAEVLSQEKDCGIINVKEYDIKSEYTVLPLCKVIAQDKIDKDKAKAMCEKLRAFFIKHQDFVFTDFHWGNIMERDNKYVIIDIDLSMLGIEWVKQTSQKKSLKEYVGTDVPLGWTSYKFCYNFVREKGYPLTYATLSLFAIDAFELAGYSTKLRPCTQEIIDELDRRFKTYMPNIKTEFTRHCNDNRALK